MVLRSDIKIGEVFRVKRNNQVWIDKRDNELIIITSKNNSSGYVQCNFLRDNIKTYFWKDNKYFYSCIEKVKLNKIQKVLYGKEIEKWKKQNL